MPNNLTLPNLIHPNLCQSPVRRKLLSFEDVLENIFNRFLQDYSNILGRTEVRVNFLSTCQIHLFETKKKFAISSLVHSSEPDACEPFFTFESVVKLSRKKSKIYVHALKSCAQMPILKRQQNLQS